MFGSILILFLLPSLGGFKYKSIKFVLVAQFVFWLFVSNVLILGWLGANVVEEPYVIISQFSTFFYFSHYLVFVPMLNYLEAGDI